MSDERQLLLALREQPELFEEIARAAGSELAVQSRLRSRYPAELVRAAIGLLDLRRRARGKFSHAKQMWFDRTGLEQASAEAVAIHKASRFCNVTEEVLDLCSGIGSDSIALGRAGHQVRGIDLSEANCLRATWNAEVYGVSDLIRFEVGEATTVPLQQRWLHIDPDRRAAGQRVIRVEDYQPGLEFLKQVAEQAAGAAIKLSPASNFGGKFPGCEIELISLHGECKEATVWSGALRGDAAMRATMLPSGESFAGNPWEYRSRVGPLGRYFYDPDAALVRAGLIDQLAEERGFFRLDDAEEYLTSETLIHTAAATPFEVLANLPHNDREIRNYFRNTGFGEVEIKARHVPISPEAIRKKLPLNGTGKSTLIIARLAGKTRAIVARRMPPETTLV